MKNKKTYQVVDTVGNHEYNIEVKQTKKGKRFKLFLSNGEQWTSHSRGQLEMTMLDTGNGVEFEGISNVMDYCQTTYIRLLLGLERFLDDNPRNQDPYTIINKKTLVEL